MRLFCVTRMRALTLKFVAGVCFAAVMGAMAAPADARTRHRRAPGYTPPYAAMVVDANTGRVLYAKNEHALRHPASITKVMTLYMLFEQLERGKLRLDSDIAISANAASQPPTKMGLRPGSTISVDNAIRALVTRSANDIAVALAEAMGGDEERFAAMMTRKAQSLGMTRTNFANASGLPDSEQVTTAHDLTILGRAVQDRFPKYYPYFSIHAFQYGRGSIRNHNKLLGRIEGVDGIKTGYTRLSGFNLLTSAKRDGRRIVGVVLGGRSGGQRDQIMADLVEEHIDRGSKTRSSTMVAEAATPEPEPAPAPVRRAEPVRQPEPVRVAEVARQAEPSRSLERQLDAEAARPFGLVAFAPADRARPAVISGAGRDDSATASIRTATPATLDGSTRSSATGASSTPSTLRWVSGPRGIVTGQATRGREGELMPPAGIPEESTRVSRLAPMQAAPVQVAAVHAPAPVLAPAKAIAAKDSVRDGVLIQIGATDDQDKANELLARARSQGRSALASARPFTEKVQKGGETLWRARFAGLDADGAEAACKTLKKSGFGCFTTRN